MKKNLKKNSRCLKIKKKLKTTKIVLNQILNLQKTRLIFIFQISCERNNGNTKLGRKHYFDNRLKLFFFYGISSNPFPTAM